MTIRKEPDPDSDQLPRESVGSVATTGRVLVGKDGSLALVRGASRVLLFVISLSLFLVAIELIKHGAAGAAGLIERYLDIGNPLNALGFGWLASYLVMSGSPVAAVSVAFLAAGALEQLPAYAMIVGSRLGASFIVLFVGFMYVLRGHERRAGLTMGLLALVVTASVYLPALLVGGLLLKLEVLDFAQLGGGAVLSSVLEQVLAPIVQPLSSLLPGWGVMLVGLVVLWVSFFLFDRALPELDLERSRFSQVARMVYRPLPMFILGSALTLITLSVSLSLSLLVPLSARGYVRRENAIPYIMGANITTIVDTLLATVVLGSSDALSVVLASMLSVTLVSLVILLLFFRRYERAMLSLVEWATATNRNVAFFMVAIMVTPLVLLLI
jgi:sodium-dependent phosphate cotransporter